MESMIGVSWPLVDGLGGSWGFPGSHFGDGGGAFWRLWLPSGLPLALSGVLLEHSGSQGGPQGIPKVIQNRLKRGVRHAFPLLWPPLGTQGIPGLAF